MALICYLTAGYPDRDRSIEYMMACLEGGADMIEMGIPFSDPVADGPVIQATSDAALRGGMRPKGVLDLVAEVRSRTEAPIVLMGYYNPIFRMGESEFTALAAQKGADGLIVPDLPLEESHHLRQCCLRDGMDLVQLVAPTTPDERMRRIASSSSGYLYLVSRMGITGTGTGSDDDLAELVRRTKACAGALPVAVGFGISTPRAGGATARPRSGRGDRRERHIETHHGGRGGSKGVRLCAVPQGRMSLKSATLAIPS